jgi:hypothetical protein
MAGRRKPVPPEMVAVPAEGAVVRVPSGAYPRDGVGALYNGLKGWVTRPPRFEQPSRMEPWESGDGCSISYDGVLSGGWYVYVTWFARPLDFTGKPIPEGSWHRLERLQLHPGERMFRWEKSA